MGVAMEGEIIRKCLGRSERQCSFIKYQDYKIIYRRYASLFFIVATDPEANELAILEFIHLLVETLDKFFRNVCELDIMYVVGLPQVPAPFSLSRVDQVQLGSRAHATGGDGDEL